jgi:hypothetical protein
MIGLNPSTCVAFCHIVSSPSLHSSLPELSFHIMIYLHAVRVDRIFGSMSLIEIFLLQFMVLWNH